MVLTISIIVLYKVSSTLQPRQVFIHSKIFTHFETLKIKCCSSYSVIFSHAAILHCSCKIEYNNYILAFKLSGLPLYYKETLNF